MSNSKQQLKNHDQELFNEIQESTAEIEDFRENTKRRPNYSYEVLVRCGDYTYKVAGYERKYALTPPTPFVDTERFDRVQEVVNEIVSEQGESSL